MREGQVKERPIGFLVHCHKDDFIMETKLPPVETLIHNSFLEKGRCISQTECYSHTVLNQPRPRPGQGGKEKYTILFPVTSWIQRRGTNSPLLCRASTFPENSEALFWKSLTLSKIRSMRLFSSFVDFIARPVWHSHNASSDDCCPAVRFCTRTLAIA